MGYIKDIRLFYSIAGNTHISFASKKLNTVIHRIVMKLREQGFSLGEFDHLYINFTTTPVQNGMAPADRPVDPYHSWFRYYDVQLSKEQLQRLKEESAIPEVVIYVEELLVTYFAAEEFTKEKILECVSCAVQQGEDMLMHFKEKTSSNRKAILYLRYSDQCRYIPVVKVYDKNLTLLLEADLPEMVALDRLGEIQLSSKKVTIKPRKNAFTNEMKPITFLLTE